MRILYITNGPVPDYQCDTLLIGMKIQYGPACVDYPRATHLYSSTFENSAIKRESLYGLGFTYSGVLDSKFESDEESILDQIVDRAFDLVVYGSVWRATHYYDIVSRHLKCPIVAIDGEDYTTIRGDLDFDFYFKRELTDDEGIRDVLPINFGFPDQKLSAVSVTPKEYLISPMNPYDPSTYVFNSEEKYYSQYAKGLFGITGKKAGWDCLRHYEIIANQCCPIFLNIEQCPSRTLTNFTKSRLNRVASEFSRAMRRNDSAVLVDIYNEYFPSIYREFLEKSLSSSVAREVINSLGCTNG